MKHLLSILLALVVAGCSSQRKLKTIETEQLQAKVIIADERKAQTHVLYDSTRTKVEEEPIEIRNLVGDRIIMNAVKDEATGEMVATEQLDAVVVEARFRNLAERHGKVDIAFNIIVPPDMQDPQWQLRFRPHFIMLGDTLNAEEVLITGEEYRIAQMRGYELYNRFLSGIIPDSADFVKTFTYEKLLRIFIERNFPDLAALATDSSYVDSTAYSVFGVTEKQAIEHYTKAWLVDRNNRRKGKQQKMYDRFIKAPLLTEGVRLDTVINNPDGTITYNYVQTVDAKKDLRKVEMVLDGNIYKAGNSIYTMPPTDPLTFYISSISTFVDTTPRYVKQIIYRNAEANTAAYIDFKVGKYNVDDTLSNNAEEIGRIKGNIRTILSNPEYITDSLVITASCSPEGAYTANIALADNRAQSIKAYFAKFITEYRDSVKNSVWDINLSGEDTADNSEEVHVSELIKTRSIPENWERLQKLLQADTNITDMDRIAQCMKIEDIDARERALFYTPDYKYIRSAIYPYLRTVKFDFYLHRKGMIKDTVQTTVIDTAYMRGVQALEDRDYKTAVTLLRPYNDFNSAVAFVCMDYNQSALSVLNTLPRTAQRDYMLAIVHARLGDERKATESFIHSVEQDYSMRHRGNLDPEIPQLIKKYSMDDLLDNM